MIRTNIRSAQNVCRVLIGRRKNILILFETISVFCSPPWTKNMQNMLVLLAGFPWWSNRVLFTQFGVMCWCHLYPERSDIREIAEEATAFVRSRSTAARRL